MKTAEVKDIAARVAEQLAQGRTEDARMQLLAITDQRISFSRLDQAGRVLGQLPLDNLKPFFLDLADGDRIGLWPIMASAIHAHLDEQLADTLSLAQQLIMLGATWHSTDCVGERVVGPALAQHFDLTLALLAAWREHPDRWVRRATGVGIHVWCKRGKGEAALAPQAQQLLDFIEPQFIEPEIDAVKGIGWGLKSMGRFYPDLLTAWLAQQLRAGQTPHATMLRKALTYLPQAAQRQLKRR